MTGGIISTGYRSKSNKKCLKTFGSSVLKLTRVKKISYDGNQPERIPTLARGFWEGDHHKTSNIFAGEWNQAFGRETGGERGKGWAIKNFEWVFEKTGPQKQGKPLLGGCFKGKSSGTLRFLDKILCQRDDTGEVKDGAT